VRLLAPLVAGALLLGALDVSRAAADPIGDKRQQAAQIANQLEALSARGEALTERYDATAQAVGDLATKLQATQAAVDQSLAAYAQARAQMRAFALRSYVHAGSGDPLLAVIGASPEDLNAASIEESYTTIAVDQERKVADEVTRRRQDTERLQAQLAAQQHDQQALQTQLGQERATVEQAIGRQQALLTSVQGELRTLLIQEQQRRAAEEEAAVKAKLAADAAARKAAADQAAADRAAADQARRDATTTAPTPSPPSATTPASSRPTTTVRTTTTVRATTTTAGPTTAGPTTAGPTTTDPGTDPGTDPNTTVAPQYVVPAHVPTPPAPSPLAGAVVKLALAQVGVPYVFGGASPVSGFDCSGLTMWAWQQAGKVTLPHFAADQYALLPKVPLDQLQPGDLVFFGADLHHVGLYIGNGQMVNAPYTGTTVSVATIYRRDLVPYGGRP